jgi:hypothetical protein
VTVADAFALPPAPVQVRVKLLVAVRAPVDWLPDVALVPDQPPEAVQEVALVEDQVSVEAPPLATDVGFAVSDTVGTPVTVTLADTLALPPAPVQVRKKSVVAVRAPVDWLPEVALVPDQPPEAVQEVALVEDQVSVEAPPLVTDVGFAASDTVGTGGGGGAAVTVTVADALALPPVPVQVRVKLLVAVSAPVDWLPEVALAPDQPPEAVQEVALVEDQVSVEAPPLVTDVGLATSDTVGTAFSTHSRAVVPSQDGLCGVPTPFLSVTSLGRGFRLRYQMRFWPAVVDIGFAISAWMSASESSPE